MGDVGFGNSAPDTVVNPCDPEETPSHWLEIELVDEDGVPVPYEEYRVILPDGELVSGYLDAEGFARFVTETPGACQVTFPNLDQNAWRLKATAGQKLPGPS